MIIISPKDIKDLKSRDLVTLECECCHGHFERPKNQVCAALKISSKVKLKYCSSKCQFQMQRKKQMVECKQCNGQFPKLPSQIKRTKNNFCSNSCAAIWNNTHVDKKHGPSKTKFFYCKICNVDIKYGHVYCKLHKPIALRNYCLTCEIKINSNHKHCENHKTIYIPITDKTIIEAEDSLGRPANKYRAIRDHARNKAKKAGMLNNCKICGYSKHIVTCHIREISSFDKQTLVSEVNDLSNLIGLCKNHHWEMDHRLLSEEDATKL